MGNPPSQVSAWTDPDEYDLASISALFMKINTLGLNATTTSQRYEITPQAIAGYSCTRSFNKVNVDVIFTRTLQPNLEETSLLSVQSSSFDSHFITQYVTYNVRMNKCNSCVSSTNVTCGSSTSWISPGLSLWDNVSPDSIVGSEYSETLDVIETTQLRHLADNASSMKRLFDPQRLIAATTETYTIFSIQLINQLRLLADDDGYSTGK